MVTAAPSLLAADIVTALGRMPEFPKGTLYRAGEMTALAGAAGTCPPLFAVIYDGPNRRYDREICLGTTQGVYAGQARATIEVFLSMGSSLAQGDAYWQLKQRIVGALRARTAGLLAAHRPIPPQVEIGKDWRVRIEGAQSKQLLGQYRMVDIRVTAEEW